MHYSFSSLILGIDTSGSCLRIAALNTHSTGSPIAFLQELPLGEGLNTAALPQNGLLATALPSKDVLVKALEIPVKKKKDIDDALEFQVEPHLPYPLEKCLLEWTLTEKRPSGFAISLFSVRKDHLESGLKQCTERGLDPEILLPTPCALAALAVASGHKQPLLLLHLGEKEGTCAVIQNGHLVTARAFRREGNEIEKTALALLTHTKHLRVEELFFLGEDLEEAHLLAKRLEKRLLLPTFGDCSPEKALSFGLAIGIALSAGGDHPPNFRKGPWAFRTPLKRFRISLALYFGAAALLAASLFGLATLRIEKKRSALQHSIAQFLGEKEGTKSDEQLLTRLLEERRRLSSQSEAFAVLPGVPRASDFLAWLSSQEEFASIQIESVHYALVRYPDLKKKEEPYLVKVDLEFTAHTPALARSFHDALVAPNAFVNAERQIQWIPSKEKYTLSFYLKDKTRYVS